MAQPRSPLDHGQYSRAEKVATDGVPSRPVPRSRLALRVMGARAAVQREIAQMIPATPIVEVACGRAWAAPSFAPCGADGMKINGCVLFGA